MLVVWNHAMSFKIKKHNIFNVPFIMKVFLSMSPNKKHDLYTTTILKDAVPLPRKINFAASMNKKHKEEQIYFLWLFLKFAASVVVLLNKVSCISKFLSEHIFISTIIKGFLKSFQPCLKRNTRILPYNICIKRDGIFGNSTNISNFLESLTIYINICIARKVA